MKNIIGGRFFLPKERDSASCDGLMPGHALSVLRPGDIGQVLSVSSSEELGQRLEAFGILPGSVIRLCHAGRSGPLVMEFRGTFLAISRHLAESIRVEKQ